MQGKRNMKILHTRKGKEIRKYYIRYAPRGEDSLVMGRPLNLEDLVLVRLETMQLQLQIPKKLRDVLWLYKTRNTSQLIRYIGIEVRSALKVLMIPAVSVVDQDLCPNLYTGRFQLENKLNMIVSENDRFHKEINQDQRHGTFWAHFQLVLDRTKPICSFWRRKWKLASQTVFS